MPLGATVLDDGTQFALFSRHATAVSLLLFDDASAAEPVAEIRLDRKHHRTGDVWHVLVHGVGAGWCYLYRVDGPFAPQQGHRFDAQRLLFDPYAKAFTGAVPARRRPAELPAAGPRCVVVSDTFDWRGDRHPRRPLHRSVIYEMHVRGFTVHPSAGAAHPGTFLGVCERIPYLRSLGVTAVELLPVHESDEYAAGAPAQPDAEPLVNYWAYNPIGLFAPKRRYGAASATGGQVAEFKQMVRELHAAGIEVILDMVFNHSPEGDATGPTLSYRGLDNSIYYLLDGGDRGRYLDFTGCRNTLNCNHPVVRRMIIDCLHYWVVEMHVDGFRFDLASVLGRDRAGNLSANTPILEQIGEDPVLRDTKIIAEAWDAAGAYQVGQFPGDRWAELNDRFRDDVRRFWRGDGTAAGDEGVRWFAPGGDRPDWDSPEPCLAACLMSAAGDLYLMLNAATGERPFAVPAAPHGGPWQRVIDTALAAPDDISPLDAGLLITPQETYNAGTRSLVLLAAQPAHGR